MPWRFRGRLKFLLVIALAPLSAHAAEDPFVGTWKLNLNRTQFAGQVAEIKDLGGHKFEWVYAVIHTDLIGYGREQRLPASHAYSFRQASAAQWVFTHRRNGQIISISVWTLLNGGQRFRTAEQDTLPRDSTGDWVIKPYGKNGLSFSSPGEEEHLEMTFDGKDYPDLGPQETPGETSCGKRIDEHAIQVVNKLNGKVTSTHKTVVSPDGRTLTDTVYAAGQRQPTVVVFEKQM